MAGEPAASLIVQARLELLDLVLGAVVEEQQRRADLLGALGVALELTALGLAARDQELDPGAAFGADLDRLLADELGLAAAPC